MMFTQSFFKRSGSGAGGKIYRCWFRAILLFLMALTLFVTVLVRRNSHAQTVQPTAVATVSAASYSAQAIAPESIVAAFGTGLSTDTVIATDADATTSGIQLPTLLGGTTVEVNGRRAGLFFVSPGQINYVIPPETQPGAASVLVRASNGMVLTGTMTVSPVAPAVFTANGDGKGVPAATLLRVRADSTLSYESLADYDALLGRFIPRPINFGPAGERVFLILFASGLRRAADPNNDGNANESVRLAVGGLSITPAYAGRQGDYAGLDQINAELPRELLGRGLMDVVLTAAGAAPAQVVQIEMAAAASNGQAPRAFDDSVNTDEDVARGVTLRGDDPNNLPLRYIVTRAPRHGRLSGTVPSLTYTPAANYASADDFTFKVNNGTAESNEATVTVNLRPVNDAPVLAITGSPNVNAGQNLSLMVSAVDVDEGQTLSFAAENAPSGAVLQAEGTGSRRFLWTPTFAQAGTYSIKFTVRDNGAPPLGDEEIVTIVADARWAKTSGPEGGKVYVLLDTEAGLYAGTYGGGIFRTEDQGRSWTELNAGLADAEVRSLAARGTTLFAGTEKRGVFRSTDRGATWQQVLQQAGARAVTVNSTHIFAGASDGVFRSADHGANWTRTSLSLPNGYVSALAASGNNLLAGSEYGGGVFRSEDNGQTWVAANQGLPANVRTLCFEVSGDRVIMGTDGSGIFSSSDRGVSWTRLNQGLPANLESLIVRSLAARGTTLFAGTALDGVYRSTDNGQDWTLDEGLSRSELVYALAFSGANLFAGTFGKGVLRAPDQGGSWTAANAGLTSPYIFSLAASNTYLFAGTFGGGVLRSADQGRTWTTVNRGLTDPDIRSLLASGGNLFAGTEGYVFRSNDAGESWTPARAGLTKNRIFALATDGAHLFAGTDGGVFVSANQGDSWQQLNQALANLEVRALAASGTALFAGTEGGGVFRSTDQGMNWTPASNGLTKLDVYALLLSGGWLYAGTPSGIFRSPDNGGSWSAANQGLADNDVVSLSGSGAALYAGTRNGAVFISTNQGVGWSRIASGLTNQPVNALMASGTQVFAGLIGGVSLLANQTQSWTPANLNPAPPFINTLVADGANMWAGTLGGGAYHSTDQGQNWRAANAGLPPSPNVQSFVKIGKSLMVGTFGNGVYRLADQGQSWQEANEGLTNQFVNALAVSGTALFAATGGGVFRSDGQNWQRAGLDNRFVLALVAVSSALYAGTDGEGVYVSTNGGETWVRVSTGLTALDIRTLAVSGTALFAGTLSGGVFRSANGGQSWQPFSNDLPPRLPVFAFATSDGRLYAGTVYGVFVSTDQGTHWRQINAGLSDTYVTSLTVSGDRLIAGTRAGGVFVSQIPIP